MKLVNNSNYSFFERISLITLIAVYFLIFVGGVVRSTGSGMGCPDWPKCFGQYVPPTSESQLPENYQEIYSQKREKKNKRLAAVLTKLGFTETADKIANDPSILEEARFNKFKTWTEYINRLVGAAIGILIFVTLVASFPHRKSSPRLFYLAIATFVLVGFEGWLGSIVVSTNLLPWTVTVHMVLAMFIMFMLIYMVSYVRQTNFEGKWKGNTKVLAGIFILATAMSFLQILLGTQVRESIDVVASLFEFTGRDKWISELGIDFLIHRSYSLLILVLHIYLVYYLNKHNTEKTGWLYRFTLLLAVVVIVEIVSGAAMAYFAIPAFIQPVHLLLAMVMIGMQYYLILQTNYQHPKEEVMIEN